MALVLRWGSWVAAGVALVLVAAFVELSEELLESDKETARLFGADAAVLRFVALSRRPWLNGIAMDLTALGLPVVVALFTTVFGALLLLKGDRRGATILIASSFASVVLTFVTKTLLERPRPAVVPRLVEVTGLSYPSGHSLASAAVYLTAALVVARHVTLWSGRIGAVGFTAAIVALIGASRVYLGVHYPSDVFGGILLGSAWASLMAAILHRLDRGTTSLRVRSLSRRSRALEHPDPSARNVRRARRGCPDAQVLRTRSRRCFSASAIRTLRWGPFPQQRVRESVPFALGAVNVRAPFQRRVTTTSPW